MSEGRINKAYALARERYAEMGVDSEQALAVLATIPLSLHCWQGDDVGGFESNGSELGGGLAVTGHYPGKARTADELRQDATEAFRLIPGRHRFNLHASYREASGKVDRDAIGPEHFTRWADWAKEKALGIDFNPTFFAHPRAADGFTLAHRDAGVRRFWINHGIACRQIGAYLGQYLGNPCITNLWIPDGYKDLPIDRQAPRQRLLQSLDEIFARRLDPDHHRDAVESKLFGIGSESYVVGSFEFYLGYAVRRQMMLCLDAGHFHPTETIADKISSALLHLPELLLHVSRGVRWDSDHVVILSDDLYAIAQEIVRNRLWQRVRLGLDFFDASINRLAAWVIGARALLKAMLAALLEPTETLRQLEAEGDYTSRLALLEEFKTLPLGAVWDHYCERQQVPVGKSWLDEIKQYERAVLTRRQ